LEPPEPSGVLQLAARDETGTDRDETSLELVTSRSPWFKTLKHTLTITNITKLNTRLGKCTGLMQWVVSVVALGETSGHQLSSTSPGLSRPVSLGLRSRTANLNAGTETGEPGVTTASLPPSFHTKTSLPQPTTIHRSDSQLLHASQQFSVDHVHPIATYAASVLPSGQINHPSSVD
jgi:hypothetical protein